MEQQYREMFDEVRSSSRLREEVTRMTKMEQRPARRRLPKKTLLAAAVLVVLTNGVKKVKDWHPIVFIALSAVVGVVFGFAGV